MNINRQFGQSLRARREKLSYTLDQVSHRLGVSAPFLWRVEQGQASLPPKHLLPLSQILQLLPRQMLEEYANCTIQSTLQGAGMDPGKWKLQYLGEAR